MFNWQKNKTVGPTWLASESAWRRVARTCGVKKVGVISCIGSRMAIPNAKQTLKDKNFPLTHEKSIQLKHL